MFVFFDALLPSTALDFMHVEGDWQQQTGWSLWSRSHWSQVFAGGNFHALRDLGWSDQPLGMTQTKCLPGT